MPTFTFSNGAGGNGFDMRLWGATTIIGIIQANFSSSRSPTQVTYTVDAENVLQITGTAFTYDARNDPASGTATGFTHASSGALFATATGFSLSVPVLAGWILAGNDHALATALFTGDDSITGTSGADILYGYGGSDTINAGDGNDEVVGDTSIVYGTLGVAGNDIINGGAGNDELFGESGNDTLDGGIGDDRLTGGAGNDTLIGGDGQDRLTDHGGTSIMSGGAGDDFLSSASGGQFDGGDGFDYVGIDLSLATASLFIDAAAATTNTGITLADGTIIRNSEVLTIIAGSGNDTFVLNAAAMVGHLSLQGYFDGGAGSDLIVADLSSLQQMLSISPTGLGFVQGSGGLALSNIERMQIIASAFADNIIGSSGDDTLSGGGDGDRIDGGLGNDIVNGGDGSDVLVWSGGVDQIDGGADIDGISLDLSTSTTVLNISGAQFSQPGGAVLPNGTTIQNVEYLSGVLLGYADDTLTINRIPSGQFSGNGGNDTLVLDFAASNGDVFFVNNGFNHQLSLAFFTSFERIVGTGSAFGDRIEGGAGADALAGNGGSDALVGFAGADVIDGGDGADLLIAGSGDDHIMGGADNDRLHGGDYFGDGLGNDILDGGTGADEMYGGQGADIYYVDSALDVIFESGSDVDEVRASVSHVLGGDLENLTLLTGAANGSGNGLNNIINGNAANNILNGFAGIDTLNGGGGNDTLDGGIGADILNGGEGDDVIIYDAADNAANVQGGGGTDILAFTSGGPPVGFGLSVHGFELAEGRFAVTGATFTDFYDGQWRLSHEIGQATNGSSWFIDWDETSSAPYQRLNQDFDASGQLAREYGLSDNGSTWDQFFDTDGTHSYVSILQVHTAGGVYANEHGINDNGSTWDTFYDVDGTNPFQWIQQVRDAFGVLAQEEGLADGGTRWFTDFDETGTTDYVFYQNVYDTLNRLSFQSGEYDTGFTWTIDYDETETQAWTSIRNDYDDNGNLIGTTTIWDGP